MNAIYEKRTEDWARRFLAQRLGVKTKGRRKIAHWQDIVCRFVNLQDNYHNLCDEADRLYRERFAR